jgi:hypothetical protein
MQLYFLHAFLFVPLPLLLAFFTKPLSLRDLPQRRVKAIDMIWLLALLALYRRVVLPSVEVANNAHRVGGDFNGMARDVGEGAVWSGKEEGEESSSCDAECG